MSSPKKPKRAPLDDAPKVVWRMTARRPMGEWVPAGSSVEPPPPFDLPEVSDGNWVTSSYDLLDGVRVVESGDTISDPQMDELFGPQWSAAKSSGQSA